MPFPFVAAATALAPVLGAGIQQLFNRRNSDRANRYNDPVNQMARLKAAGLNPNLMYQQGNTGVFTPVQSANWQDAVGNAPARYTTSELQQTQTEVGEQKINESIAKAGLMEAQQQLVRANPYLNEQYVTSLINVMVNTARIKQQETGFLLGEQSTSATTAGIAKMQLELNALAERNNLMTEDKQIKAQILQSEKFRTELLQMQRDWLKDGDFNAGTILEGIKMLLMFFK